MTKTHEALALMTKMVETGEAPDLGAAYVALGTRAPHLMAAARAEKQAPVTKDVAPTPAPEHWSIANLKALVTQRVQKSATPLTDTAAWSAVLASEEGQGLVKAYYESHKHLRRQGG